jgi:hypothetical protein
VSQSGIIVPAHFDRLLFAHMIIDVLPNLCILFAETRKEEAEDIPEASRTVAQHLQRASGTFHNKHVCDSKARMPPLCVC